MNKYLIISDIHLGDKDCKAELLLKVLKQNKAKTINKTDNPRIRLKANSILIIITIVLIYH